MADAIFEEGIPDCSSFSIRDTERLVMPKYAEVSSEAASIILREAVKPVLVSPGSMLQHWMPNGPTSSERALVYDNTEDFTAL